MTKKKAIIVGYGGMGKRYHLALKKLDFDVIGICDSREKKIEKLQLKSKITLTKNYKDFLKTKADIVCIVSNTESRFNIVNDFLLKSRISKIITEKPLSTSYNNCLKIYQNAKRTKKRILVNTFRTLSNNFLRINSILKKNNEKTLHIFFNSPSAGLGNMGSTFFDISNFFIKDPVKSVVCWLDKRKTISPRGKQFKDPGGYGVVNYKNGKRAFFDLSEDTSLPYKIIIKSENFEFTIDELNNKFSFEKRPSNMRKKPLYFFLYKPNFKKIKIKHPFDVARLTELTIKKIFKPKFSLENLKNSLKSMEIIFACHASSKTGDIINLPLKKKYYNKEINFA